MGGLGRGDVGLKAGFQFEFNPRILPVDPGVTEYTVVSSDDQIVIPANFPTGVYVLNLMGRSPGQVPLFDGQHLWISDPMGKLGAGSVLRVVGRAAGVGGQVSTGGAPADFLDLTVPGTSLILTYSAALNTWDVLDGSSGAFPGVSSDGPSFVYREGEPSPSGNVFATWAGAYAAATACRVDCLIAIDNSIAQCHVTAGAYVMTSIALRAFTPSTSAAILDFDDGAIFTGAFQAPLTLALRNMGSAPVFTTSPGLGLSVVLDRGSVLTCGPGAAPFLRVVNGSLVILPMFLGTRIANQPGTPIIQVDAGGALQVISGPVSAIDQDVFTGGGAVIYLIASSSAQFSTIQTGLTSPVQVQLATGARKVGFNDPTPRLVEAPEFGVGNANTQEAIEALRRGIDTIIFRPGVTSRFPAYETWNEIQQIVSTSETPITVLVDPSFAPAEVPGGSGITDFRGGILRAFGENSPIIIRNGAQLQNVSRIEGFGSDNLFAVAYECTSSPCFSFSGSPASYAIDFTNVALIANAGPNVALRVGGGDIVAVYGNSTTFPVGGGMIENSGQLTLTARKRGGAIAANYVPDDLVVGTNAGAAYTLFYDTDITGGLGFSQSPIPTLSGFAGTYEAVGVLTPLAIPTGFGIPVTADRPALPGELLHVDVSGGSVQIALPPVLDLPNGTPVIVKCVALSALNTATIVPSGGGTTIDGGPSFVLAPVATKDWALFVANSPANSWDVLF